jgi:hypothetical protein
MGAPHPCQLLAARQRGQCRSPQERGAQCRCEQWGQAKRLAPSAGVPQAARWDFRGFVLSDYGATHSVHALLSGQDQEYPGTGFGGLIPSFWATGLKPLVDPSSTRPRAMTRSTPARWR